MPIWGLTSGPTLSRRSRSTSSRVRSRAAEEDEQHRSDPVQLARTICLRLLQDRPRTRAELEAQLLRRGIPSDAAEQVLERFGEVGLVDDAAFAQAWVTSRHAGRGLARRALSAELRRRGVEAPVVAAAVGQLDDDAELATARALVARRLPATAGLAAEVRVRRLVGMLARKGYPPGTAYRVVKEALADQRANDPAGEQLPEELALTLDASAEAEFDDPLETRGSG